MRGQSTAKRLMVRASIQEARLWEWTHGRIRKRVLLAICTKRLLRWGAVLGGDGADAQIGQQMYRIVYGGIRFGKGVVEPALRLGLMETFLWWWKSYETGFVHA